MGLFSIGVALRLTLAPSIIFSGTLSAGSTLCRGIYESLVWEVTLNPLVEKPTKPVLVAVTWLDGGSVEVDVAQGTSKECVNFFVKDRKVAWPKHPLNEFRAVPFFDRPTTETWPSHETASRSLVPIGAPIPVSLKLPTDHPHRGVWDGGKGNALGGISSCYSPHQLS